MAVNDITEEINISIWSQNKFPTYLPAKSYKIVQKLYLCFITITYIFQLRLTNL